MHKLEISISQGLWFDTQRQMAEFLYIKNTSKKAIASRCKAWGYGCTFDDYFGEHNIQIN
jgi:hypothetical protein